jgi:hypothetical protein
MLLSPLLLPHAPKQNHILVEDHRENDHLYPSNRQEEGVVPTKRRHTSSLKVLLYVQKSPDP